MNTCNRYVIGREHNVVHVDFGREPDPPAPKFPGAAALRVIARHPRPLDAFAGAANDGPHVREAKRWMTSN